MSATSYGPKLPISEATHKDKYRGAGENFCEAMTRIANTLADGPEHFTALREIFLEQRFLPAGRIQAAIGSPRITTAYNCFVSGTIGDSMDDIMEKAKEAAQTMRMGGGIGYDFSTLRPRGARIKSLHSKSSGPLSFMNVFNAVCGTVRSAGHRRGAQMGVMRVDHPDIEEFVSVKSDLSQLTNFNLSVGFTDEFMTAVQNDLPFDLRFGGQVHSTINARSLWDKVMRVTWDCAEPGALFIDRINRKNNLWYCEHIAATNPCVPAGTPILTGAGWIPIDELVDQKVPVWNGYSWSEVVPKVTGVNQELVEVKLSNGTSLVCTPAHKFVLPGGTKVRACNLHPNTIVETGNWPVIQGNIKANDAYEQGFFSGDGWVETRSGKQFIGLYGVKKLLVHKFNGRVQGEYKISGGYVGTDTTQTKIYVEVFNKVDKSFVPTCIWDVDSRLEWLAGIFDSDGCVARSDNNISLQLSAKNKTFLTNVQLMLNTLGVHSSVGVMGDCYRLVIAGSKVVQLQNLGFGKKLCRLNIDDNNPQRDASRKIKVVSVTPAGTADTVYCFTEEKRHMGCFNGILTGNCGEQPLPPYGACLLGSFNITKYLFWNEAEKRYALNHYKLAQDLPIIVRAMDNVINRTTYPLPQQKTEAELKRRMGLGVTGVANALEVCGLPYGSPGFLQELGWILITVQDNAYHASTELAKEKGSFPLLRIEEYLRSEFALTLDKDIRDDIRKYGIRNSHLLSIAPTGTISLCADNISSGIEPVFSYEFNRTIMDFDGSRTESVSDWAYREHGVKGVRANDLPASDHVKVLNVASKFVDSACSKTCNVGDTVGWEEFKDLYMQAYLGGASGCTTFRAAGKRYGILNAKPSSDEEAGSACYIDPLTGKKTCE